MCNLRRVDVFFSLAIVAALGAAAGGAQAQSSNAPCSALRDKLDASLTSLRSTHMDLQRLKAIMRGYDEQHGMSILPATGLVVRMDDVDEKARNRQLRIEQLTQTAGVYRAEIKKCEGTA